MYIAVNWLGYVPVGKSEGRKKSPPPLSTCGLCCSTGTSGEKILNRIYAVILMKISPSYEFEKIICLVCETASGSFERDEFW